MTDHSYALIKAQPGEKQATCQGPCGMDYPAWSIVRGRCISCGPEHGYIGLPISTVERPRYIVEYISDDNATWTATRLTWDHNTETYEPVGDPVPVFWDAALDGFVHLTEATGERSWQ